MLNSDTRQVLSSIQAITNSAIINYPVTTISNPSKDVLGNINIDKLEDETFDEFGIFDLGSFLGALSILEEPTIELENGTIKASDANSAIDFITSSPAILGDFTTSPKNITSTVSAPSVVEVELNTEIMGKLRKGVSAFKTLKDVFIVKEGDTVYLKTGNKESFSRGNNSYKMTMTPSINEGKDFELAIPIENLLSLPSMDYDLKIKYNETRDAHRVVMSNDIFDFVLSVKA